jgi:hypothetical protein
MIDLDAWAQGERLDISDPDVLAELRRLYWRDEAREVALKTGMPTDDETLDRLAKDLQEELT